VMALSGGARTRYQVNPERYAVAPVPRPYVYRCPFGSGNEIECGQRAVAAVAEEIERQGVESFAAVLMEPNAGTNGIVAPDNYWPGLRQLTRSPGVFLIADEVMSGFGRCGEWFAWQRYGDAGKPDLMTLAKGLTGAHLPLGAVVVNENVARHLENQMLFTGLTYCGHPLACAAGIAAIRAYEDEKLIERSRRLGAAMFGESKRLHQRHRLIGDVRGGHGLFAVIELVRDTLTRPSATRRLTCTGDLTPVWLKSIALWAPPMPFISMARTATAPGMTRGAVRLTSAGSSATSHSPVSLMRTMRWRPRKLPFQAGAQYRWSSVCACSSGSQR